MIDYDIFINNNLIYKVEIRRIESLKYKYKLQNYEWQLYDTFKHTMNFIAKGKIRHKYMDGVFILINKANKQIHNCLKNDPKTKQLLEQSYEKITLNQALKEYYKELQDENNPSK